MIAYIFDVWARMDSDDIAMLDSEVVSNHSVHACGAIIQIIICKHDQDSVLSLFALDQDCVSSEELQGLHSIVREGDDGVVIVSGISDAVIICQP